MPKSQTWRNRIVGSGTEAPDQLLANPKNWRIHPKHQQDALDGALDEIGWIQQVIVNQRTGHVIDGHLRVALAIGKSEPSVPVVYVDLSEDEERLALATLDPLSAMAGTDREQLDALLRETGTTDTGLLAMLDGLAVKAGLMPPTDPLAEWQGMPEFGHADLTAEAAFTIRVFLNDADDLAAFGQLLGKDLTGRKFVWFGKQPQGETYEVYDGPEA